MSGMLNWIKSWFQTAHVCRQLSGSQQHLDALAEQNRESETRIELKSRQLEAAIELVRSEIRDAERIHRRMESALDEVREQNRVLEKTIQTLVASHELLISRYDAETALAVRARVAASASRE